MNSANNERSVDIREPSGILASGGGIAGRVSDAKEAGSISNRACSRPRLFRRLARLGDWG